MNPSKNNTRQSTAGSEIKWTGCHARSSLEGFMEEVASVRALKNVK